MTVISRATFEAARTFAHPANRVRPEVAYPRSAIESGERPSGTGLASAAPSLVAGDAHLILLRMVGSAPQGSSSIATQARGLEAYQSRLTGRLRYFGPATPVDLSV